MIRLKRTGPRARFLISQFKLLTVFFPIVFLAFEAFLIFRWVKSPSILTFAAAMLCPYVVPLSLFRLHQLILSQKEGSTYFGIDYYNPWLTGFRLQLIFIAFPFFERILIFVPGLFSAWLRLWGSKIGKGVMWTPHIEICDRANLEIGDHVFFGNKCYLSPHVVKRLEEKKFLLYLKNIRIGNHSSIGAGCRLGPGVSIDANIELPLLTDVSLNTHVTQKMVAMAPANDGGSP